MEMATMILNGVEYPIEHDAYSVRELGVLAGLESAERVEYISEAGTSNSWCGANTVLSVLHGYSMLVQ